MADYMKPLVLVYQELRNVSATLPQPVLPGIVIGPCYQYLTYLEDKSSIFVGEYDSSLGNTFSAPAPVPGMNLVTEGLKLYFDDLYVKLEEGIDGVSVIAPADELNKFVSATATFETNKVKVGDTLVLSSAVAHAGDTVTTAESYTISSASASFITDGVISGDVITIDSVNYVVDSVLTENSLTLTTKYPTTETTVDHSVLRVRERKVLSIYSETIVFLSQNIGFAATGITYTVKRLLNDILIDASFVTPDISSNSVTVASSATTPVDLVNLPIISGKMYLEYKALRTDVALSPQTIESTADIENKLGKIIPENPLAYGASIMFDNAAVAIFALGVQSNDSVGFSLAKDIITERDVYVIALLTQDKSIIATYKAHAEAFAVPEKNKFRLVIGNHDLPTIKTLVSSQTTGSSVTDPNTTKIIFLDDSSATFISSGVIPGDEITIETGALAAASPYIVDKVLNENRLQVMVADEFASVQSAFTYSVTRSLTKDQQAEEIKAGSESFGSKRCIMTFPATIVVDDTDLPGYYLNASLAGMVAGLPSQAGLTSKGIASIDGLKYSNFYFTDDQLDVIASGGTCIFVQQTETSLPYIRHQLTTDMTLLETKEISVVKNNDYLSIFFREIVKPFLGEWNVTPELIGIIKQALNSGITYQVLNKVSKIGAPLISAEVETVEVSSISADRVEVYINTVQPRPLNNIGLHMII